MCRAGQFFLHLVLILVEGNDQSIADHDFAWTEARCAKSKGKSKTSFLFAPPWHSDLGSFGVVPHQTDAEPSPFQGSSVYSSHYSRDGVVEDTCLEMPRLQAYGQGERCLLSWLWPTLGSLHGQELPRWQAFDSHKAYDVPWTSTRFQQLGMAAPPISKPEAETETTLSQAAWVWTRLPISTQSEGIWQRSRQGTRQASSWWWKSTACTDLERTWIGHRGYGAPSPATFATSSSSWRHTMDATCTAFPVSWWSSCRSACPLGSRDQVAEGAGHLEKEPVRIAPRGFGSCQRYESQGGPQQDPKYARCCGELGRCTASFRKGMLHASTESRLLATIFAPLRSKMARVHSALPHTGEAQSRSDYCRQGCCEERPVHLQGHAGEGSDYDRSRRRSGHDGGRALGNQNRKLASYSRRPGAYDSFFGESGQPGRQRACRRAATKETATQRGTGHRRDCGPLFCLWLAWLAGDGAFWQGSQRMTALYPCGQPALSSCLTDLGVGWRHTIIDEPNFVSPWEASSLALDLAFSTWVPMDPWQMWGNCHNSVATRSSKPGNSFSSSRRSVRFCDTVDLLLGPDDGLVMVSASVSHEELSSTHAKPWGWFICPDVWEYIEDEDVYRPLKISRSALEPLSSKAVLIRHLPPICMLRTSDAWHQPLPSDLLQPHDDPEDDDPNAIPDPARAPQFVQDLFELADRHRIFSDIDAPGVLRVRTWFLHQFG